MTLEQKSTRQRSSSNATSLPIRTVQNARRQAAKADVAQPKSTHTSDDFLQPFLSPSFDAAAFLNATLPPLAARQQHPFQSPAGTGAVSLAELSGETQALVSQLNAHTTRLSDTLTQLTDEIIRSGSRLAYEVELLRGETLSLSETLSDTLREDIEKFVPGGLDHHGANSNKKDMTVSAEKAGDGESNNDGGHNHSGNGENDQGALKSPSGDAAQKRHADMDALDPTAPDYLKQLQTLTLVRERLDSVIKVFGDAMDFTFPPSEVSVTSGFLSVSAPEPGSAEQSSEERGQQVLKGLRDEISSLLNKSDDPVQGIESAAARIQELKELTAVWKGTAEEKGRAKFIESLAKLVEDRHRDLIREMDQAARREGRAAIAAASSTQSVRRGQEVGVTEEAKGPGGFGLISQLQKLRNGL